MSLIILNEPSLYNKTKKEKEAALIKYAEHLTGRVKVYEPTSSEDWENVIKKYSIFFKKILSLLYIIFVYLVFCCSFN